MILAPIVPRTRESLADLIDRHPDRVEHGLSVVQRELQVRDGVFVDLLARDAEGGTVLVFVVDPLVGDLDLATRILTARHWVLRNRGLLLDALPDAGLRDRGDVRVICVAFDYSEDGLTALDLLREHDLTLLRSEAFSLGGRPQHGLTPLHRAASADAVEPTAGDSSGVARLRAFERRIVDVLRRLDPEMTVRGQRFTRQFHSARGLLAELSLRDHQLFFRTYDEQDGRVLDGELDDRAVADAVLRAFMAQPAADACPDSGGVEAADEVPPPAGRGAQQGVVRSPGDGVAGYGESGATDRTMRIDGRDH